MYLNYKYLYSIKINILIAGNGMYLGANPPAGALQVTKSPV